MKRTKFIEQIKLAIDSESEEIYIAEQSATNWLQDESYNPDDNKQLVKDMKHIYWLANTSISEIMNKAKIGNTDLIKNFGIPRRTIEDWKAKNNCSVYNKLLIAEALGLIKLDLSI